MHHYSAYLRTHPRTLVLPSHPSIFGNSNVSYSLNSGLIIIAIMHRSKAILRWFQIQGHTMISKQKMNNKIYCYFYTVRKKPFFVSRIWLLLKKFVKLIVNVNVQLYNHARSTVEPRYITNLMGFVQKVRDSPGFVIHAINYEIYEELTSKVTWIRFEQTKT